MLKALPILLVFSNIIRRFEWLMLMVLLPAIGRSRWIEVDQPQLRAEG